MPRTSHNSPVVRILAVGRDISLLSSGANLLTLAGYSTDFVLTPDDAARRVSIPRYDLAIVSTTFTYDEQIAIRNRIRQLRPQLPVLVLSDQHDSPAALFAAVSQIVRKTQSRPLPADPAKPLPDTNPS